MNSNDIYLVYIIKTMKYILAKVLLSSSEVAFIKKNIPIREIKFTSKNIYGESTVFK